MLRCGSKGSVTLLSYSISKQKFFGQVKYKKKFISLWLPEVEPDRPPIFIDKELEELGLLNEACFDSVATKKLLLDLKENGKIDDEIYDPLNKKDAKAYKELGLIKKIPVDPVYGRVIPKSAITRALRYHGITCFDEDAQERAAAYPSKILGCNSEGVKKERFAIVDSILKCGEDADNDSEEPKVRIATISKDSDWIQETQRRGVLSVNGNNSPYENVVAYTREHDCAIHAKSKAGKDVVIGGKKLEDDKFFLSKMLQISPNFTFISPPQYLIPLPVASSSGNKITQLSDWVDLGYAIYEDRDGNPHLFISGIVERMADILGRLGELEEFKKKCEPHFAGIHIIESKDPYLSPVNGIDLETRIFLSNNIADHSLQLMRDILGRDIRTVPSDLKYCAQAGYPGLRCNIGNVPEDNISAFLNVPLSDILSDHHVEGSNSAYNASWVVGDKSHEKVINAVAELTRMGARLNNR